MLALLRWNTRQIEDFARTLQDIQQGNLFCQQCFHFSDDELCSICNNPQRVPSRIAVVEQITDLIAIENTGLFNGTYHVLGGHIDPVKGALAHTLKIPELVSRINDLKATHSEIEIILATSANTHGETTALYLQEELSPLGIKTTRLARGLASGSTIEYVDALTLANALKNRT